LERMASRRDLPLEQARKFSVLAPKKITLSLYKSRAGSRKASNTEGRSCSRTRCGLVLGGDDSRAKPLRQVTKLVP
jgi:hypothetical protein